MLKFFGMGYLIAFHIYALVVFLKTIAVLREYLLYFSLPSTSSLTLIACVFVKVSVYPVLV